MKMIPEQTVIIRKDIGEVLQNRQVLLPMIILPAILMALLPALLLAGSAYIPEMDNDLSYIMDKLPASLKQLPEERMFITLAVEYFFPVFFILIPLMASSIIGASSFVTEKERNTLESLFYTPLTIRQIFAAKVTGTFVLAYLITLLSFILLGISLNIGGYLRFGEMLFPSLKWLIILLWLSPSITLLGLTIVVWISAKAKSFQEAQQKTGMVVIPFIFVILGQATGLFFLNSLMLIAAGALLFIVSAIMLRKLTARYSYEKLLSQSG